MVNKRVLLAVILIMTFITGCQGNGSSSYLSHKDKDGDDIKIKIAYFKNKTFEILF